MAVVVLWECRVVEVVIVVVVAVVVLCEWPSAEWLQCQGPAQRITKMLRSSAESATMQKSREESG